LGDEARARRCATRRPQRADKGLMRDERVEAFPAPVQICAAARPTAVAVPGDATRDEREARQARLRVALAATGAGAHRHVPGVIDHASPPLDPDSSAASAAAASAAWRAASATA